MLKDLDFVVTSPKFKFLWTSQILSQLTINIMNFLLLIRLFTLTGSTIATSFIWISYALPAIVIGPFAAAIADTFNRKTILMMTNLLQSMVIFAFANFYSRFLFLTYGVVVTYSFLNQFYFPAEAAVLPTLVPKKNLPNANALFFMTQLSSLIIGFGIAGTLSELLGFENSIFILSGFLFLAFISVSFLPKDEVTYQLSRSLEKRVLQFFKKIIDGYKFIKERREILFPFVLLIGLEVGLNVVVINLPILAREVLKIPINSAGRLLAAPGGLGAAAGAFLIPRLLRKGIRKKRLIEYSLGVLTIVISLIVFMIPGINSPVKNIVSTIIFLSAGLSFIGIFIPCQTFLQEATPGGMRGRVFGNFWFLTTVISIFPVLFSATITELLGVRFLFFIVGSITFASMLFSRKYGEKLFQTSNRT